MASLRETSSPTHVVKRIFVGRSMASGRMEHTLLPKILALPIFASDALSSVAYSVEASLVILVGATANIEHLILPINLAVAGVMAIVITSYRQVVRAYPTSAGSYVVSKDNLATIFGLIAAAALLADYVLTVAVSVSSGILAISSAMGGRLNNDLVWMSIISRDPDHRGEPARRARVGARLRDAHVPVHPLDVRADRRRPRRGASGPARR